MANVKFKRGAQSALNKYLYTYTGGDAVTAEEGCFYLTEDTNRLYIGKEMGTAQNSNIKAVPINQGAIPVDNVNGLPTPSAAIPGQFYYVVDGNILAVASQGQWVQINVNTNTDNYIDERQMTSTTDTANHTATITDILYNKNNSQIASEIDFIGANGFDVSVEPTYALAKKFIAGVKYYTLSGGVYTENTTVNSGNWPTTNNTYYIRRGYAVTLTPATYTLSASVASNNLTLSVSDGGSNTSSVTINHGNNISFSESNGTITLTGTDTNVDHIYSGTGNGPNTNVAYDSNGNIVTQTTHGFYVQVHNTNGATAGTAFDPQIKVGSVAAYQETVQFDNGVATLPVYTTTEVDNKIRLFNAMEYQGVAYNATFDESATNIKSGYVWMAGDTVTIGTGNNAQTAHAGDLIIASGTEESNGYILPANIDWDVITSGTQFDTQPTMDVSNTYSHGFAVGKTVVSGGTSILGAFQVAVNSTTAGAGQYLSATDEINGTTKVVRIVHNETNPTFTADTTNTDQNGANIAQASATAMGTTGRSFLSIPVPVLTYDDAGHITAITTYEYKVVDSHISITNSTLTATSSVTTQATITSQFQADGQNVTSTMNVNSETIKLSANSGALVMNIEWDTFN